MTRSRSSAHLSPEGQPPDVLHTTFARIYSHYELDREIARAFQKEPAIKKEDSLKGFKKSKFRKTPS